MLVVFTLFIVLLALVHLLNFRILIELKSFSIAAFLGWPFDYNILVHR